MELLYICIGIYIYIGSLCVFLYIQRNIFHSYLYNFPMWNTLKTMCLYHVINVKHKLHTMVKINWKATRANISCACFISFDSSFWLSKYYTLNDILFPFFHFFFLYDMCINLCIFIHKPKKKKKKNTAFTIDWKSVNGQAKSHKRIKKWNFQEREIENKKKIWRIRDKTETRN